MIAPTDITLEQLLVHVARADRAACDAAGLPFFASVRTLACDLGVTSASLAVAMRSVRLCADGDQRGLDPWMIERQARGHARAIGAGLVIERREAPAVDHPDVWRLLQRSTFDPDRLDAVVASVRSGATAVAGPAPAPTPTPAAAPLTITAPHRLDPLAEVGFVRPEPPRRFVSIDVETTDSSKKGRVIEFAAVFFEDGAIVGRVHTRINPEGVRIAPFASDIHGLYARDLVGAPTFAQVARQLHRCIEGKVVVAHNLAYDRRMLAQDFERVGMAWPKTLGEVCTLRLAKQELPHLADHKLPTVCRALGLSMGRHHEAEGDAEACGRVLVALEARERREVAA